MEQMFDNFVDSEWYMFTYDEWDNITGFDTREHDRRLSLCELTEREQALVDLYTGIIRKLEKAYGRRK